MQQLVVVVLALAPLLLGLPACLRLGFDWEKPADAGAVDQPVKPDGAPPDIKPPPGDFKLPLDKRQLDKGPPDKGPPDKGPPDKGPLDKGPPDKGPPNSTPCNGSTNVFSYEPGMVICQNTSKGFNICGAYLFCKPPWKPCTASQFLARGGKTNKTSISAWIWGCVRDNGPPIQPKDGLCTSCQDGTLPEVDIEWSCASTDPAKSAAKYVGIATNLYCRKLGASSATAVPAYWRTWTASNLINPAYMKDATVCCW